MEARLRPLRFVSRWRRLWRLRHMRGQVRGRGGGDGPFGTADGDDADADIPRSLFGRVCNGFAARRGDRGGTVFCGVRNQPGNIGPDARRGVRAGGGCLPRCQPGAARGHPRLFEACRPAAGSAVRDLVVGPEWLVRRPLGGIRLGACEPGRSPIPAFLLPLLHHRDQCSPKPPCPDGDLPAGGNRLLGLVCRCPQCREREPVGCRNACSGPGFRRGGRETVRPRAEARPHERTDRRLRGIRSLRDRRLRPALGWRGYARDPSCRRSRHQLAATAGLRRRRRSLPVERHGSCRCRSWHWHWVLSCSTPSADGWPSFWRPTPLASGAGRKQRCRRCWPCCPCSTSRPGADGSFSTSSMRCSWSRWRSCFGASLLLTGIRGARAFLDGW